MCQYRVIDTVHGLMEICFEGEGGLHVAPPLYKKLSMEIRVLAWLE